MDKPIELEVDSHVLHGPDDTVQIEIEEGQVLVVVMHDHVMLVPPMKASTVNFRMLDEDPEMPTVYPAFVLVVKSLTALILDALPDEKKASLYTHLVEGHRKNLS